MTDILGPGVLSTLHVERLSLSQRFANIVTSQIGAWTLTREWAPCPEYSMVKSLGSTWFVSCMEAVRISEGLLWEVLWY